MQKEKIKKKIKLIWPLYFIVLASLFALGMLLETHFYDYSKIFIIACLICLFPGMILPMVISSKLKSSISLNSSNRDMPLIKKDIRAVCSIDVLLNNLQAALEDEIIFYALKYAYDDVICGIGYEKRESVTYFLLQGETEQNFVSLEELRNALVLNHDVTVLDEYQSSDFMNISNVIGEKNVDIMPMNLKDNYILKSYIVDKDSEKYNLNIGSKIQEVLNNKN